MSCKSYIYTSGPTPSAITTNAEQDVYFLPLGTVRRQISEDIQQVNNGVQVNCPGIYDGEAAATITFPTAGTYTVGVYVDGVLQPGQFSTETVVADQTHTFNIPFSTRLFNNGNSCCNGGFQTVQLGLTTAVAAPVTFTVNNSILQLNRV